MFHADRCHPQLLRAAAIALPFVGARVLYGLIYYVGNKPGFQGSFAARLLLGTIPEMIVIFIFVAAGLITRDMYAFKGRGKAEVESKASEEPYVPLTTPQAGKTYAGAQYNRQDRPDMPQNHAVSRW